MSSSHEIPSSIQRTTSPSNENASRRNSNSSTTPLLSNGRSGSLSGNIVSRPTNKEINRVRKKVLSGQHADTDLPVSIWRAPRWTLRIYLSSTGDDVEFERNVILNDIYPRLRHRGREYGIEVIVIDMRDRYYHQGYDAYMQIEDACDALEECILQSAGLSFLTLQAQKHGEQPLPTCVPQNELDSRVDNLAPDAVDLIRRWYSLDSNAIPPHYVITPPPSTSPSYTSSDISNLLQILNGVIFDPRTDLSIGASISEMEIHHALQIMTDSDDSHWFHRSFSDLSTSHRADANIFDDTRIDTSRHERVSALTSALNRLPATHYPAFPIDLFPSATPPLSPPLSPINLSNINTELNIDEKQNVINTVKSLSAPNYTSHEFMKNFPKDVYDKLSSSLRSIIRRKKRWDEDGDELFSKQDGMRGSDLEEMLCHCEAARDAYSNFSGRKSLVRRGHILLAAATKRDSLNYGAVKLVILGSEGTGKTSLMCKLAGDMVKNSLLKQQKIPLVIRICGTTTASSSTVGLLQSIILQLSFLFKHGPKSEDIHIMTYIDLVRAFREMMRTNAVILIIDGMNELKDDEKERNSIGFLKQLQAHDDSIIIVSSRNDDLGLRAAQVPVLMADEVDEGIGSSVWSIMCCADSAASRSELPDILFNKYNRSLSEDQRLVLIAASKRRPEPSALYLRLAVLIAREWRSFDNAELGHDVASLIHQLIATYQRSLEPHIVHTALAFLSFAQSGLTDNEMIDLLSLELVSISQPNSLESMKRFPISLWLRLKRLIKDLVISSASSRLRWSDRHVKQVMLSKYKADMNEYKRLRAIMGNYFSDKIEDDIVTRLNLCRQTISLNRNPIWWNSCRPNKSRCIEAGLHLIEAGLLSEAAAELCNIEIICATIRLRLSLNHLARLDSLMYILESKHGISMNNYSIDGSRLTSIRAFDDDVEISETVLAEQRQWLLKTKHFIRWLQRCLPKMKKDPATDIFHTCTSDQPLCSLAREAVNDFLTKLSISCSTSTGQDQLPCSFMKVFLHDWDKDCWYRCRAVGGKMDFDSEQLSLTGHNNGINAVAISSSGLLIASGSEDSTIIIWDAYSGANQMSLCKHTKHVLSIAFSLDGLRLVSGGDDKMVIVWDIESGNDIATLLEHSAGVNSVTFSNNGRRFASGSGDKSIRIWSTSSKSREKSLLGHSAAVLSVAFNQDDSKLVSGSADKSIKVWDAINGVEILSISGHGGRVNSVCWDPNDNHIISGSEDCSIRIWNASSGVQTSILSGHKNEVLAVHINAIGTMIASGCIDSSIKVWSRQRCREISHFDGHTKSVASVQFNHKGSRLVSGSRDTTVKIWSLRSHSNRKLEVNEDVEDIRCFTLSPNGQRLVTGGANRSLQIWDPQLCKIIESNLNYDAFVGHQKTILSTQFNPDGNLLVSAGEDKTIIVWDAYSGASVLKIEQHTKAVNCVCFSHDGKLIASASDDERVIVWDASTGEMITSFCRSSKMYCVCFSADDKIVIAGAADGLHAWTRENGLNIRRFEDEHSGSVFASCFNYDGSRFVSAGDERRIILWNFDSKQRIRTWDNAHDMSISCLSFSPDGTRIVSGSHDKTIAVWDATTSFAKICNMDCHNTVRSVCFSLDFGAVISGGGLSLLLWDSVKIIEAVASGEKRTRRYSSDFINPFSSDEAKDV